MRLKNNKKGFAISTMLYGMLIIAAILTFMILGVVSFSRKSNSDFLKLVESDLNTFANTNNSKACVGSENITPSCPIITSGSDSITRNSPTSVPLTLHFNSFTQNTVRWELYTNVDGAGYELVDSTTGNADTTKQITSIGNVVVKVRVYNDKDKFVECTDGPWIITSPLSCPTIQSSATMKDWRKQSVTVNISDFSSDTYKWELFDNDPDTGWGDPVRTTYNKNDASYTFSTDGKHAIGIKIYDNSGNVLECSRDFKKQWWIDKTPPVYDGFDSYAFKYIDVSNLRVASYDYTFTYVAGEYTSLKYTTEPPPVEDVGNRHYVKYTRFTNTRPWASKATVVVCDEADNCAQPAEATFSG